jgi:hypothetical protein
MPAIEPNRTQQPATSSRAVIEARLLRRRSRLHGGFDGGRQMYSLAQQLSLDCAYREITWAGASGRSKRSRDVGSLTGEPTLWDLAQKCARGNVATSSEYVVEPFVN